MGWHGLVPLLCQSRIGRGIAGALPKYHWFGPVLGWPDKRQACIDFGKGTWILVRADVLRRCKCQAVGHRICKPLGVQVRHACSKAHGLGRCMHSLMQLMVWAGRVRTAACMQTDYLASMGMHKRAG